LANYLFAVLVPATATAATIDRHLRRPMRRLLDTAVVDGYRLGGALTGAWDPDYRPHDDPANWHPCTTCNGTTRNGARRCAVCAAAPSLGRPAGTMVAWHHADWAPYPGDIVALPRLLDPAWRFPAGRTPDAWVDPAGIVWLATTQALLTGADDGDVPARLHAVFDDLRAGRRNPRARGIHPFDPARWAVAVVQAHH
jgi:hypothetical protein